MDIDGSEAYGTLMASLGGADWAGVLSGVGAAEAWLGEATPGDPRSEELVSRLVALASHSKWEVRRAVANAAAQALNPAFERVLAKLVTDDNARVRQAAEHAALRRRDWQNASALGKQHEDLVNATLDNIEVRFGRVGRDAVRRASEQIANTFARELYHEIIKLLSPLALSAERLSILLSDEESSRTELAEEASRIERRVAHLSAVLNGMRAYTEQPKLTFRSEPVNDILEEAASLIRDADSNRDRPGIHIHADAIITAEVSRPRMVQALMNVLANAVESYVVPGSGEPIVVRVESGEGRLAIAIQDFGCGMSEEALNDAKVLFATSKPNGTGFGLPLAVKIVESEHGGRLSLKSEKGRGTLVEIVIPTSRPRIQV